ncbi:tyrosine--tRNA ligase [Desulfobaculum bizertense]|uniref:Tyrosine--tRNA ligase n=1 Tax=Desulfobaculum bizertense DSM 18034 TaxID=1121442 RepID=A0A1T4WS66_9BACT|nr:tyrosine--tRNA ligase [Desulfobaculum bizertense]UIJ37248.1 tyrosine--tRNA ligase [Desulfobaculum bizertense]SKA80222.1 tyrosyl-tRNA synthetase [Desulfobaculum bizertense DSM 18034]
MNIIDELKWRGLIFQTTDEEKLREYFETPGRTLYCGFDPSANSLHCGNLVPLLALLRFKRAGHKPMALMGGATGRIGDPSGKDQERQLLDFSIIDDNIDCIRKQVHKIFGNDTEVLNNYDWTKTMNPIEFLRDVGKYFTVNEMMRKESVRQRIVRDEVGISYTEFSYMILQSMDYDHLYNTKECRLQIGGSDQWGNITAGTELIRKKSNGEAFALTFPLLTTATGAKFGKSEKGAIYLDPEKTSPWEFYQFWVNTDDRDVVRLLKVFTFKTEEEIKALEQRVEEAPHMREAQKALAEEMTILIHGREELDKILGAVDVLFGGGDIKTVDIKTLRAAMQSAPSVNYDAELPQLADMLVDLGIAKSKGQAKKDIKAGAVRINGEQVTDMLHAPSTEDFLHDEVLLIKKGKKHYGLVTRN